MPKMVGTRNMGGGLVKRRTDNKNSAGYTQIFGRFVLNNQPDDFDKQDLKRKPCASSIHTYTRHVLEPDRLWRRNSLLSFETSIFSPTY
jgi:hypothetical protein